MNGRTGFGLQRVNESLINGEINIERPMNSSSEPQSCSQQMANPFETLSDEDFTLRMIKCLQNFRVCFENLIDNQTWKCRPYMNILRKYD